MPDTYYSASGIEHILTGLMRGGAGSLGRLRRRSDAKAPELDNAGFGKALTLVNWGGGD
jgi:hypothetical protein